MTGNLEPDLSGLLETYSTAVPRYTSYPTAPHFHGGLDATDHAAWFAQLDPGSSLSLYLHVPYCDTLCWFCGCHTKITRRYAPVTGYLSALYRELETVSGLLPQGPCVPPHSLGRRIADPAPAGTTSPDLPARFPNGSMSTAAPSSPSRSTRAGLTWSASGRWPGPGSRAPVSACRISTKPCRPRSTGARVSRKLPRRSSGCGARGSRPSTSMPCTACRIKRSMRSRATMDMVIELAPDRIALFGYAHVPWLKRHQKMIEHAALPDTLARYRQAKRAAGMLRDAGYLQIGAGPFRPQNRRFVDRPGAGRLEAQLSGLHH